ncbi:hypothetical protein Afil01_23000 [Actinorhabdospora filicis]|uniref:Uncharacterized protein n=1 Tax=Actinorhabdospora filicis TaxID=1785913 RepID=A0A9W6SJP4_9ACTN|nr:hypothetical protein Afil01_23000 [Actinorhabdospora filicis]
MVGGVSGRAGCAALLVPGGAHEAALALARQIREAATDKVQVVFCVAEMKRLARDAAKLMIVAAEPGGPQLRGDSNPGRQTHRGLEQARPHRLRESPRPVRD